MPNTIKPRTDSNCGDSFYTDWASLDEMNAHVPPSGGSPRHRNDQTRAPPSTPRHAAPHLHGRCTVTIRDPKFPPHYELYEASFSSSQGPLPWAIRDETEEGSTRGSFVARDLREREGSDPVTLWAVHVSTQ